jgi:hypothetical protein
MKLRNYIIGAWVALGGSVLLIAWQLSAYLTDNIPGHILPAVHALSGTQEAVPIAYTWTIWMGLLSVMVFIASLATLVCAHLASRQPHNEKGRQV